MALAPLDIIICITIAISMLLNISFISKVVGHLRGPLSRKTAHAHDTEPLPPPPPPPNTTTDEGPFLRPSLAQIKLTLYLILTGLSLALIHLSTYIVQVAGNAFYNSNPTIFSTKTQRDEYERYRTFGRLSYVRMLAEILTNVFFFVALITVNRLLLTPRVTASKVNPSRARRPQVADAAQILMFLGLGLAFWFSVLAWRLQYHLSEGAQNLLDHVHNNGSYYYTYTFEDIGSFSTDANETNAIYIFLTFVCWAFLMMVTLSASLLRKIAHSRKAGLAESERCTLVLFTKWVVPGLVVFVAIYAVAVFLRIFRDDISLEALGAAGLVESLAFLVGNLVGFGMSVWAAGKTVDQHLGTTS